MKITDLQLEQYGIYHNASWKPSRSALNVVMGENESGKTTMLRFIRDMLFGYGRGKWQGSRGNMGFIRSDGKFYRVHREEKNKWFENENHVKFDEELPGIWWHGLNRYMYEKIFAVGLEDLQGASFLSNDTVRSRFFMLQGGDKLANAKEHIQDAKSKLFTVSSQGKRKINQLFVDLDESNKELDSLSTQEKDFSELQYKQTELKDKIKNLQSDLKRDQEENQQLEKQLGAWDYYQRASAIKHQLDLSSQVKMFPSNGKEQWNRLMNRMKVIHDQKELVQEKIDQYTPVTKEQVIPWLGITKDLEQLYVDLGQWKQTIADSDALDQEIDNWKLDFINLGYSLPLWDHALDIDNSCVNVDWEEGRRLSKSLGVRNNELHFWKQREPKVDSFTEEEIKEGQSEEDWQKKEEAAVALEKVLTEEADISQQINQINGERDKRYTLWFWLAIAAVILSIVGIASFYMAMAGYISIYLSAGSAVSAVLFYVLHNKTIHKKGKILEKFKDRQKELEKSREDLSKSFSGLAPKNVEEIQAFHNLMQEKRAEFYKEQAKRQAISWKRETVRKQEQEHDKWIDEGNSLREKKQQAEKEWKEWLSRSKFPDTGEENLSSLQEQWQKIYSEEGKGKILAFRREQFDSKLDEFSRRAYAIISATGLRYDVQPESIAEIYEENHRKTLEWEAYQEKNKQHESYEEEMRKLNENWNSCKREMDTLLNLVNAATAEEFAEKVNAHEHHDQLIKEWDRVKQDLRMYAGSEKEFNSLWKSLETGQYDEWMEKHQSLTNKIKAQSDELGELQRNLGAVENEIFRLANDDSITSALQKKERIEAELYSSAKEWLELIYTEHLLNRVQAIYESGRQPEILKQANTFLSEMTMGKYSLSISDSGKEILIEDNLHRTKDAKIWSSGTGDQVYLAIRLAMALSFGEQIEELPIVLDDIFVRFDEQRQRETLRFLLDLGQKQQIFLFTCHARTMHIAEEVGREKGTGEFIRLSSGTIEKIG